MNSAFEQFHDFIVKEQEIRDAIRDVIRSLDDESKKIQANIQKLFRDIKLLSSVQSDSKPHFEKIKELFSKLSSICPSHEYYRYHDHWRNISQKLVNQCALLYFLEHYSILSLPDAASMLNLADTFNENQLHLDLEDYLSGILLMASDLSRLATNCVIQGDFETPQKISTFLTDIDIGFRLLNLKNDSLRKRYDGLKYDVKKVEEILYDLRIRGLKKL